MLLAVMCHSKERPLTIDQLILDQLILDQLILDQLILGIRTEFRVILSL